MKPKSAEMRASDQSAAEARRKAELENDPLERVRLLCLARGPGGMLELGRAFRRLRPEGGLLEKEELQAGLRALGLGEEAVAELLERLGGRVELEDFLARVRPSLPEARAASLELAFAKLDPTGAGQVELEHLRSLYDVKSQSRYHSGADSAEQILAEFMANFERGALGGVLTKEEFFNYYAGVSASIDTDAFFDLMIRRAYKI